MKRDFQKGQVLLLVLLAMAALATMTLSVVSRSVSEVSVTTREEESLRAFSAAEAGVEEALVNPTVGTSISRELEVPLGGNDAVVSTYSADIETYPENPQQFAYPFEMLSGEAATVWLVTKNGDTIAPCGSGTCFNGTLTLCWGKPGATGAAPAVLVNVIYSTASGYASAPIAFDPDVNRRSGANPNMFLAPDSGSCSGGSSIAGQNYLYRANVDLGGLGVAGTPILMRVAMLYNESTPQIFGVSTSSGSFPTQGRRVSSEGQAGEATRRIDAFLLNPEMPYMFDAALYSEGGISK